MRKFQLEDRKLSKILEERGVVFKDIVDLNKKIEDLEQERTKLAYKMDRLKERTVPIIEKVTPLLELKEFEIVSNVKMSKGKPEIEIVDRVQEFADALREEKKEKKEKK